MKLARALLCAALVALPAAAEDDLELRELAECLTDSGAVFYGAHWCPYCRKQLQAFAPHDSLLPYVECYEPGERRGMRIECELEGVKSFPTWIFPDGSVATGALSPTRLAQAADCS